MTERKQALGRRTWMGGAATAGAAAFAVTLLPSAPKPAAQGAVAAAEPPAERDGYRLSEHVKQYYASARV